MTFWANRGGQEPALPPASNGADPGGTGFRPEAAEASLPPFVEGMVKRLLATVLPQFQPVIQQAEAVMADMRQTLAELKANQLAVRAELERLRRNLEPVSLKPPEHLTKLGLGVPRDDATGT